SKRQGVDVLSAVAARPAPQFCGVDSHRQAARNARAADSRIDCAARGRQTARTEMIGVKDMARGLSAVVVAASIGAGFPLMDKSDQRDTAPREPFEMRVVTSGLADPFQVTWGPDSRLWVTERTAGRITRVQPADGTKTAAITIREVLQGDGGNGLLGMALDAGLLKGHGNDFVYVVYTYDADPRPDAIVRRTKVARLTYDRNAQTLGNIRDVLTGLPAGNDHQGGRLAF